MQRLTRTSLVLLATVCLPCASCSSSDSTNDGGSGGAPGGTGGQPGTGGRLGSSGGSNSGGRVGSGGNSASGGTTGTSGTAGASNSGGRVGSGGDSGSGGGATSGGRVGSGGDNGSGGQLGSGGASNSGGRVGSGGTSGSGGGATSGGRRGSGGRDPGSGGRSAAGDTGEGGTGGTTVVATGGGGGVVDIPPTACSTGTAQSGDVTVDLSGLQQRISGFGVSSAWAGSYANASDPDYLWSTTKGAGLSLLRIRYGDGLSIAKAAAQAGVTVWMTPWGMGNNGSPGGPYTTTQNNPNGCNGSMPVLSDAQGWASALVSWVQNAKTQGVPIYAVSAENEPDSCGINQTTSYSAAQLAAWIDVLGPAMAAIDVKVMAPETMNACGFKTYFDAIKNDPAAWDAVDIFASHEYGCGTLPSEPTVSAAGKEYWETEVDTGANGDSSGVGIGSALPMAKTLHDDLTKANLNAWHIWWLYNTGSNGGYLYNTGSKQWSKRLWVLGNWSRFVRPGYMRVSTTGTAPSGVMVTAFRNLADGTVVVVAINNNNSATPLSLFISGVVPCTITPWVTSAADNLASKSAITVSDARFSATLDAQSVTSFVGTPQG
jgi:glucuronoarabinoxylan endo-1,4-beta-xylanase